MVSEPINKYFVFNAELKSTRLYTPGENEGGIYEVVRVMGGIPLFLEDHLARFFHSAELSGKTVSYTEVQIKKYLDNLIDKNKTTTGNILLSFKTNLEIFFIPHNYPTETMYKDGVSCGILKAERENPNAKILNTTVRFRADQMIEEKRFYEVLLLDHLGKITEGSRSNIFFIEENQLVTSPAGKVLLGITRQKTLEIAKELNIRVVEREVNFSELKSFSAAFLTGTSPKILPVVKVDAFKFDPKNEIVIQIMNRYDGLIESYLQENKR